MDIEKLALELTTLVKGAGDEDYDFGDFAHFFDDEVYGDCGPVWIAICDRAEQLLPTVTVSDEERASWARADREFRAEQRHEAHQLGYGA